MKRVAQAAAFALCLAGALVIGAAQTTVHIEAGIVLLAAGFLAMVATT